MPPPSAAPQSNLLRGVIAPLPETARGTASQLDAHEGRGELLYCNGRAVVRRSLVDPYLSEAIHVHTVGAAVARFAPSGEWIASGDASGLVKVWASGAPLAAAPPSSWGPDDHFVKNEAPALGGKISDVRWSPDGTKVACCGDGRGALAKCFAWDGMKTFGEFDGLSKRVNALDYRPAAGGAGAIVTGGEDCSINLFRGPPFKFDRSIKEHASFVSAVRWSPDGARFATASSDRRCLIHGPDGGAPLLELKGHEGSLFGCVWSPDGQQILTCSADRTCRLWDATTGQVVCSVPCGASDDPKRFQDQQVGVAWVADFPVSLSLSAELNMLDLRAGSVRTRVNGHAKTVTHLAASDGKTFTASYDGRACAWDASEAGGGAGKAGGLASATLHANAPIGLAATKAGDQVVTAGFDDALALSAVGGDGGMRVLETLPLEAQPKAVAISEAGAFTAVAMAREVRLFARDAAKGHALSCALPLDFDATAVACHPAGTEVAVGGADGKVRLLSVAAGAGTGGGPGLSADGSPGLTRHRGAITCLAYAPPVAGSPGLLASGDANREVLVWDLAAGPPPTVKKSRMVYHTARITGLAWSPDGAKLASCSLDTHVIVWPMDLPSSKRVTLSGAHPDGANALAFIDNGTLATAGADGCLKMWAV